MPFDNGFCRSPASKNSFISIHLVDAVIITGRGNFDRRDPNIHIHVKRLNALELL
jgi:hypothetical protein